MVARQHQLVEGRDDDAGGDGFADGPRRVVAAAPPERQERRIEVGVGLFGESLDSPHHLVGRLEVAVDSAAPAGFVAAFQSPVAHWPEQDDFPEATFLEVGWGDRDYYQDPDPGVGKLLKAGLWPTKSVLHVVGFSRRVTAYFPRSEIIRIDVPEAGVDSLAAYIHDAYARDDEGRPFALGPGLYGESRFYAGRQRYHVFKNCNTWAARALRAAGVRVRPAEILTADDLLAQARPFGETIQSAE